MDERTNLALVVSKPDTGEVIDQLRTEGVYDDTRRIRERDAETVEVPIVVPPESITGEIIEQQEPESRVAGLDDLLAERGFDQTEIATAPNAWAVIGDVILVRFEDCPRRSEIATALLDLQNADTVLDRKGIAGEHREPDVEVVAGSGDTETVHTEHGTKYALDLASVMFSPGNKRERVRMGEIVEPGERVLDMFAGVGYFALPMARAGAEVTAIERNPNAFQYLVENAPLNDVTDQLRPFRGDCREVVEALDEGGDSFERIVMGYYDAHEYLDAALSVVRPGTVIHMHEATPDAELPERPINRLSEAAQATDWSVEVLHQRRVKTYSEGVYHVVVDAKIE